VESLKRLNRKDFERFLRLHEPALIIMEACGSSHYWCRELQAIVHEVRQLPANTSGVTGGAKKPTRTMPKRYWRQPTVKLSAPFR